MEVGELQPSYKSGEDDAVGESVRGGRANVRRGDCCC